MKYSIQRRYQIISRSVVVFNIQMFTMKCEVGIILLENLKFGDRPMKMLDKTKIMTPDQVKVNFSCFDQLIKR
jgi:hypothetical protein